MYFFDLSSLFPMQLIRRVAQRFILVLDPEKAFQGDRQDPFFGSHLPISILHKKIRCNYQSPDLLQERRREMTVRDLRRFLSMSETREMPNFWSV